MKLVSSNPEGITIGMPILSSSFPNFLKASEEHPGLADSRRYGPTSLPGTMDGSGRVTDLDPLRAYA